MVAPIAHRRVCPSEEGGKRSLRADHRLLRDARAAVHAREREHHRADESEAERKQVGHAGVQVVTSEVSGGRAQRRDLRQRQIDEDDAALDHVHAQIGVNPGQDETGDKGRRQEVENLRERQVAK